MGMSKRLQFFRAVLYVTVFLVVGSCTGKVTNDPSEPIDKVFYLPSSTTRTSMPMNIEGSDTYCNPPNTEIWLVSSTTISPVGEDFEVELHLKNEEASDALMGQIQYRLNVTPNTAFDDLGPVDSVLTLYPGDSNKVTFQLKANSEGMIQIVGSASYELHALDFSWGSWSGCESYPLEVEVISGMIGAPEFTENPPIHQPSIRTGIPEVDDALIALLARDEAAIKALIMWNETECTSLDGLGGPPKCRAGEQEGTPVKVLPFLGPEGHFLREEDLGSWSSPPIMGLYTVYRVSSAAYTDRDYPAGDYGITFLHGQGVSFVTFRIAEGRLVRIDYDFGFPPDEQLLRDAEVLILPPL